MKDFMKYDFCVSEVTLACYVSKEGGKAIHQNRPTHGLAFHVGGDKDYVFENGRSFQVCKNKIIYLPKGSNYEVVKRELGECYAINFTLADEVCFEPFSVTVKNAGAVLELFKSSYRFWKRREQSYEMECKANLYRILCILQQEASETYMPSGKARIIAPAVDQIHKRYTENNLCISDLSALCYITPEYFRRIFKSIYGVSPLTYINRLKLNNARELIESGMYTVTEAAEASGYEDMSHFSRAFKKEFGFCARDYK